MKILMRHSSLQLFSSLSLLTIYFLISMLCYQIVHPNADNSTQNNTEIPADLGSESDAEMYDIEASICNKPVYPYAGTDYIFIDLNFRDLTAKGFTNHFSPPPDSTI